MSISAGASSPEPVAGLDVLGFSSWCEFMAALPAGDVDVFVGLRGLDPGSLSASDAVAALVASQKLQSSLAALDADLLIAAAGPRPVADSFMLPTASEVEPAVVLVEDVVREEIAAALHAAPVTVQRRIDTARLLCGVLTRTRDALDDGLITAGHVTAVVQAVSRLDGSAQDPVGPDWVDDQRSSGGWDPGFVQAAREVEDRYLPVAIRNTPAAARRSANRAVEAIDAEGAERRRRQAMAGYGVHVMDDVDNTSVLSATMSTPDAHALLSAITALAKDARLGCDEYATIGQRRIEALKAFILGEGTLDTDSDAVEAARIAAHLNVIIPLDALTGASTEPGTVNGATVAAAAVRDLIAQCGPTSTIRRLVTDPVTGHLLDAGRNAYAIPDALRRFVEIRDQYCRFPGCSRRATSCEIDHTTAWGDGGRTDRSNLGALCKRHHQLKTHAGWQITNTDDHGACIWTSPQKRRYDRAAAPLNETPPKRPRPAKPPDDDPPGF